MKLTNHLQTDSEKVCAIHSWITHHIKYDVKKWLEFNYSRTSVKKILKSRKAICTGYSDLFNELCKHAKIISTSVPGYTRNANVDLNDKFYLDDHIWNAVYINDQWKLIDVGWDAGYVKLYKQTFLGYFVYIFTLTKYDIYKYKPHFITAPHSTYFYKGGNFFKTDHIPADPIWQLTPDINSIEDLERDSAFYFHKYDMSVAKTGDHFDNERLIIASLEPIQRMISDGLKSNKFNHKNHYSIGNSYLQIANNIFGNIDTETPDTLGLLKDCDSVNVKLNAAILHYDSNLFYITRQKAELKSNNEKKRDIMNWQNNFLLLSTKKAAKDLALGKILCISGKKLSKRICQNNNNQFARVLKNTKFDKTEFARKLSPKDSALSHEKIRCMNDSLNELNLLIVKRFKHLDSLHQFCMQRIEQYSSRSGKNKLIGHLLCSIRFSGEDDLDYNLRLVKDSLMSYKPKDDSLLIEEKNGHIVKWFYKEFSYLKKDFATLYKHHKSISTEYANLKKFSNPNNILQKNYNANIQLYKNELKHYHSTMREFDQKFDQIKKICTKQKKHTKKERKVYVKERNIELQAFKARSGYINKHFNALARANKNSKRKCITIQGAVKKLIKRHKKPVLNSNGTDSK